MQTGERDEFERHLAKLCAGFETPLTPQRKEAFWTAFQKIPLAKFARLVELALTDAKLESMPTVGMLRKLGGQDGGDGRTFVDSGPRGPSLQEQLCDYVMLSHYPRGRDAKFTPDQMAQTSRPWTYLYREWVDEKGRRCAECTGVLIPAQGALAGYRVTVADMLGDPLHDFVMERARHGGARPQVVLEA